MTSCFLLWLPPEGSLPAINHARELLVERGMGVLGAWALLNLLVSGYWVKHTDARSELHYLHQMNAAWNVVNALIAAWGLLQVSPNNVAHLTLAESQASQARLEQILLVNIVLDAGYVLLGSWLRGRAPTARRPERLLGFGRSLWLQGGFLFGFDAALYLLYHRYAGMLAAFAE
ncbi:DUF6992 family protein [Hymenobacter weizhouensis]|uniref:DUF6992 family protein n=1 Tax=Hymenobacter sp. YIM 151500-1 TaxID=2987689 RepID=UPI00222742F8|nr:hypothetical protein [Hymenobacter sp. YIM 151500-1]UYZ62646.1 hypothetical protein OIS53_16790 [Hymenobacter sp. YIM 151500-1]